MVHVALLHTVNDLYSACLNASNSVRNLISLNFFYRQGRKGVFPDHDIILGELNDVYSNPVGVWSNCASTLAALYCLKLNKVDADLITSGEMD